MAEIRITGQNGKVATFTEVQQLTSATASGTLKAAASNGKDDVLVSLGRDLFLASGRFEAGFKPAKVAVNGVEAKLMGTQLVRDESFGRKFLQGMNFASVRIGAGAALVGMLGGAWVAGTFFAGAMPVMWAIAGAAALLGFLGTAYYQAKSGDRLDGEAMFGAPQAARWAQDKLHGR